MKHSWGFNAIPELQGRSTAQQRQLWYAAFRSCWAERGMRPAYGVLIITFAVCLIGLFFFAGVLPGVLMLMLSPIWGAWWGTIGFTGFYQISAPILRPSVIRLLAAPHHP